MENNNNKRAREEEYEWLTPREGILRRPDTYVGSVHPREVERVVLDVDGKVSVVKADVSPALEKIFDEIVTNAIDQRVRDPRMTYIHISIDATTGEIFVSNDGSTTIPTTDWPGTTIPTPQVLFHELNSGSNLDDSKRKAVGGRNGVGATVTNYMSDWFQITIADSSTATTYFQRFEKNGEIVHPPVRGKHKRKMCTTTFAFLPDYTRLGCTTSPPPPEVLNLLRGRAVDAAACTAAQVSVNDKKVPARTLRQYALAFGGAMVGTDHADGDEDGCGVQIVVTDKADPPVTACFVNGVRCVGTLLDALIKNLIVGVAVDGVPPRAIAAIFHEHLSVFIAARIRVPEFGSQSKDVLVTPVSKFGFAVPACTSIAKRVDKVDAIKRAVATRIDKSEKQGVAKLLKTHSKSLQVAKHERATHLGKKGVECTLYVAEGDSAKQMIVAGFSVIGRERNGVFPLRGKLLNVHDASASTALKSAAVLDLLTVLDLDPSKTYDAISVRKLPYRRVMVVTDQDNDGSHIFGLLLALFERFFPSLTRMTPHFIHRFVTPVIRVRMKSGPRRDFFSTSAYRAWEGTDEAKKAVGVDYYKGLGTSTNAEAVEYFCDIPRHTVAIEHNGDASSDALAVFFAKERIDDRRALLRNVDGETCVDYSTDRVAIEVFCKDELVHFSRLSIDRAIPHIIDGLKPSTRKILHHTLKHPKKIKVEQLAGEVAKDTAYHHGAQSLEGAIVGMAQGFCGSNNLNLLEPLGQFGTRHGEKAASARYIHTALSPIARDVFRTEDDLILEHLVDDGQRVEPRHFCPIVPLVLINGAEGIGTGWSTRVPTHRPRDVVDACRRLAHGKTCTSLVPWVRGFKGQVTLDESHVVFDGIHEVDEAFERVRVCELPPGVKTNDLKAAYHAIDGVVDVLSNSTMDTVDMEIIFEPGKMNGTDLKKKLKLSDRMGMNNMHLVDADGTLRKYETTLEILEDFGRVRLEWYAKRIAAQIEVAKRKLADVRRRANLVERVACGDILLIGKSRRELKALIGGDAATTLLGMNVDEFTEEKMEDRRKEMECVVVSIDELEKTTPNAEWIRELDEFESKLDPAL